MLRAVTVETPPAPLPAAASAGWRIGDTGRPGAVRRINALAG